MNIIQMLIPDDVKPRYDVNGKGVIFSMKPEFITVHETANTAKGANDLAHANLQINGNSRKASWHLQVDDDSCYQSLPFDEAGIHAGDGTHGRGNRKSVGVEICVNSDGNYEKALVNAAIVIGKLMKQLDIPIDKVVPHKHWSGKNCPARLLDGRWNEFVRRCASERLKLDKKEEINMTKDTNKPSEWAKGDWDRVVENGYFDGTRPGDTLTREESGVVINRVIDNIAKYLVKPLEQRIGALEDEIALLKK